MRILVLILLLCTSISAQTPAEWWNGEYNANGKKIKAGADSSQKESVLWYTKHYGVPIGVKDVLETSGGKNKNHGEDSCGDLGLYYPEAKKRRPELSERTLRAKLNNDRHFQGELAKEIDDENRHCMRFKKNPELCTAMVYPGWKNWNNPNRLNRGLLDLQWQEYLRRIINE